MAAQNSTIFLEFPPEISQHDIRALGTQLNCIEGVETDLQTSRDPLAVITLVIEIVLSTGAVAASIKSAYDVGEILFTFLHRKGEEKASEEGKKKIVLKDGEKEVQIYGYSPEEIRQLLSPKP